MQKRLISELQKITIILLIGISYYFLNLFTGFAIPCLFNKMTGYLCPACGITRMIKSLLAFDVMMAYSYNKCLFITWPLIVFLIVFSEIKYIKTGSRALGKINILIYAEIGILLSFGVIRNII